VSGYFRQSGAIWCHDGGQMAPPGI
jgi:hypothetical protein